MRTLFLNMMLVLASEVFSQAFTEPSKLKAFNITVNFPDYTVKTQMLSHNNKKLQAKSELTYMWYTAQKIMETRGGFDGKLIHGTYRSFYLNNQLKEQGQVKYGLKHKVWKYWYSTGALKESITWKNGEKCGTYCIYNDEGKLMAKSSFKNDKLDGRFYTYDKNGKLLEKKKYKNGVEIFKKIRIKKKKLQPVEKPKKEPKLKKEKRVKKKAVDTGSDKIIET